MSIDDMLAGKPDNILIEKEFNTFFQLWDKKKAERFGLHASTSLQPFKGVSQYCHREQTLNKYYVATGSTVGIEALRRFYEGWYVHAKWQDLFRLCGVAVEIEKTRIDPRYELYYTPDAIIDILNKRWVVEIKSMNDNVFTKQLELNVPPANALDQAHLYMWLCNLQHAIVLIENKNNQNFKAWAVDYDPVYVQPFINRLDKQMVLNRIHEEDGRLAKRIEPCQNASSSRARNCPMRKVC